MATISTDVAIGIILESALAVQDISNHRWYTKQLVVFEQDGKLMGFYYDQPATELQEDQETFEADPVPTYPVVGVEVKTTIYEVVEE